MPPIEKPTTDRLIEILRINDEAGDILCGHAADEIERLRLTDAEVAAIRLGELACPGLRITDRGKWVDVWATLRGLRERTSGTHATPAQGSVQGQ